MWAVLTTAQAAKNGASWAMWMTSKARAAYELFQRGKAGASMRTHEKWYWVERENRDAFPLLLPPPAT